MKPSGSSTSFLVRNTALTFVAVAGVSASCSKNGGSASDKEWTQGQVQAMTGWTLLKVPMKCPDGRPADQMEVVAVDSTGKANVIASTGRDMTTNDEKVLVGFSRNGSKFDYSISGAGGGMRGSTPDCFPGGVLRTYGPPKVENGDLLLAEVRGEEQPNHSTTRLMLRFHSGPKPSN